MLQIKDLSYEFPGKSLFTDVSFMVQSHSRVGLIGGNGSGKSTLAKIIVGQETSGSGDVFVQKGARIGYLPQVIPLEIQQMTLENFLYVNTPLNNAWLQTTQQDTSTLDPDTYSEALDSLSEQGGYTWLQRFERVLKDEFAKTGSHHIGELSSGEQRLAYLNKLSITNSSILVLDEPTNFLDLKNLDRIYRFLHETKIPYLIISHDRHILNNHCDEIVELMPHGAMKFSGNYDDYLMNRELKKSAIERSNAVITKTVHRLEKTSQRLLQIGRQKDIPSLSSKGRVIQGQIERLRMNFQDNLSEQIKPNLRFGEEDAGSNKMITLRDLIKIYDDRFIFENAELEVYRKEKLAVVGYNGSGKSTLLRIIAGIDSDYDGQSKLSPSASIGYFGQDDSLTSNLSIDRVILKAVPSANMTQVYQIMNNAGLKADSIRDFASLSGGERSRLKLAILAAKRTNLLLLDEPTNHLDLAAREALEESIIAYEGTVLVVSHDFYFLDNVADNYILINDGKIKRVGQISQEVFLEISKK